MAIHLEIFAHFCSKLMNIRSGWRKLGVPLVQREFHQVLGKVSIWLNLRSILNFGSILEIKVLILRSSVETWAWRAVTRPVCGGTWISDLLDLVRQVLRLREALVMSRWKMCWLRSYLRVSLGDNRQLELIGAVQAHNLASELAAMVLWPLGVITGFRRCTITWWRWLVTVWYIDVILC